MATIRPNLDHTSDTPLYLQLSDFIRSHINSGHITDGEKLPPTRDLAIALGINRATVTQAYETLESQNLLSGQVGRGSFVKAPLPNEPNFGQAPSPQPLPIPNDAFAPISFSTSRPPADLFPLEDFRLTALEVLESANLTSILQIGSPYGYQPLRDYLLDIAKLQFEANSADDLLITNGCQQALDLLRRTLVHPGDTVLVEDPVYPGLTRLLRESSVHIIGLPVTPTGLDIEEFQRALRHHTPRLLVLTPNFQNPTGATIPLDHRRTILDLATRHQLRILEIDIYSRLRYSADPFPSLKQLDGANTVIQIGSFSKIAFPGLRCGWILGHKSAIATAAQAKQWTDLHTDQLTQSILHQFARQGHLESHRTRVIEAGRHRLQTTLGAIHDHFPDGTDFTTPDGGMNLWLRLPDSIDAFELSLQSRAEGVAFLPGRYFSVSQPHTQSLRLSFAGLTPDKIQQGVATIGRLARAAATNRPLATAMV